jgi:hypothetical protein
VRQRRLLGPAGGTEIVPPRSALGSQCFPL